jgi:RimJ/RimL family protein N-acetyltransferase
MPLLQTSRLDLIPGTADILRAELAGPQVLAALLRDVRVPAAWPPDLYDAPAVRFMLTLVLEHPGHCEWAFYYVARRNAPDDRMLVGAGGFKGMPNSEGVVEIGYSILREYQRQGYATEAVDGWLRFAFDDPRVRVVVAQTLRPLTPSIRVLEKAGFHFAGSGSDPQAPPDEDVIRFELTRAEFSARTPMRRERT